jgi:glycosyltransferase involved in cell wall biosynthesis
LLCAARTIAIVARNRPKALIVTNPPFPAAFVGWAAGRLVGARVVLDSHPGSFGAQGDRVAAKLLPLHRRLVPHVDLSMVGSEQWRQQILEWGGDAVVVHEAPGDWELTPAVRGERLQILFVGHFAPDEPWREVIRAAAQVPGCDIHITGDAESAPLDDIEIPDNVKLVGFMDPAGYKRAVEQADAVLCLTTEPESIMRSAYEAVWAGRPLIASDWPAARETFPHAIAVDNDGDSIAAGIRRVDCEYERLAAVAPQAHGLQLERIQRQLSLLRAKLGLSA